MYIVQFLSAIITIELWRFTLARVPCPQKLCRCDENGQPWKCEIRRDQDQIDCSQDLSLSEPINVNLNLINFTYQRKLTFFNYCKVGILKISSDSIPGKQMIKNLESLNYLIIDGTQKNSLSGVALDIENFLSGLNKLKQLKIENIKLDSWSSEYLSVCQSVEIIILKNLQLENIDFEAFVKCFQLKILTIIFNQISRISILSFKGLKYLTHLSLSSNQCEHFTTNGNGFREIGNLIKLDLSSNRIAALSMKMFIGLVKLQQLHLNNNDLEFIDNMAFEGLISLVYLNLLNNPKLIVFDLLCLNPIKANLIKIFISADSIQCVEMKSKLSDFPKSVQKVFYSSNDCQSPSEMTRHTTTVSETLPLKAGSPNMVLIVVVAVAVTLLMVGIFVGVFTGCSMKKKIRKYKNSCSDRLTSHSNSLRNYDPYPGNHTIPNHLPLLNETPKLSPRYRSNPILSNTSV